MGYVNFKEENYKAENQLNKRRENNKKLFSELKSTQKLPKTYNPDKEYSYKEFNDKHFGNGKILDEENFIEIANSDIICTVFNGCTFGNIKFKECTFIGCIFNDCDFESGGVIFKNCSFLKEESEKKPALNRKDNFSCEFNRCKVYAKFDSCTLSFLIFDNSLLHNVSFELCDMTSAIIYKCELKKIRIEDCDLSGAKFMSTYIVDLEFTDKMKTKLDEKTFFDKIKLRKKDRDEYEGIYMVYETIADKFKENSLSNNFGEYYYLCKKVQRNVLDFWPKINSYIYCATCGYGERPLNSICFSLVMMFIFGVLYYIFGIRIDDEVVSVINNGSNQYAFNNIIENLKQSILLSINLFSGVGANETIPANFSEVIASVEIIFGVIMMGIGTGTVVRKLVR